MEKEFVMLKPDAVQRGLIGTLINRLERTGLKIIAMKFLQVTQEMAEKHYEVHKGKPFYPSLVEFITSGPVVAMVLEGKDAVSITRKIVGATNPAEAAPGTIRGDFGINIGRNLIHASDSPENALTEIAVYFTDDELVSWEPTLSKWFTE
ncbi:MAG: nucleoside-diphosphate kinase [Methanobacteriota archaeon]|nr:MAG: nucleoside-diphosphate kinase [Euryarchaeota archaeon]